MQQSERINDYQEGLRVLVETFLRDTWTSMPGIIQDYNPAKNTCTVRISIKTKIQKKDGSISHEPITLLQDVLVIFPCAGDFYITFPIKNGDECLVCFAARNIDTWWQQGGVQQQQTIRLHDLSDGFAIPGPRSLPNVPLGISATNIQIRTKDNSCRIEMTQDGKVNIVAPGGVHINGQVIATGEGTFNGGHTVSGHIHPDPQGGSTGGPTG